MKKQIANIITSCRILCSIWLLFLPVCSFSFDMVYLLCGLTDMVDGTIARITQSATPFGSKLDSIADLIFVILASIKLFPVLSLPSWLWSWILVIFITKMTTMIWNFVHQKRMVFEHRVMNKLTGFLLFLLPLSLSWIELQYSAIVVCIIASVAAIQERYDIKHKNRT